MRNKNYLTPLEWEVIDVIWKLGGSPSVREVIAEGFPSGEKAYTTVQTIMNNMEVKGFLNKKKIGLVNFYTPLVQRRDMLEGETRSFVKKVFGGSFLELANYLMNSGSLSRAEIENLKQMIRKKSDQ